MAYNHKPIYNCLPNVTKDNFRTLIEQMIISLGHEHVWLPAKFALHVYWVHSDEYIYDITFIPYISGDIIMLELVQGSVQNNNVLRLIRFHLQQHNIIPNDFQQIITHSNKTLEHTAEKLVNVFTVAIRPNCHGMEYSMFPIFLIYIKYSINHMKFLEAKPDAISVLFNIIQGAIKESIYRRESYHIKYGFNGVFNEV